MDAPQPPATLPKSPRRGKFWLLLAPVLLCLAVAIFALSGSPEPQMSWLNPHQVVVVPHDKIWEQIRRQILRVAGPLVTRWRRTRPVVRINVSVLTASNDIADQLHFGLPFSTNAAGLRAWILPSETNSAMTPHLRNTPGLTILSSPGIQTLSGSPARLQTMILLNDIPPGDSPTAASSNLSGAPVPQLPPPILHPKIAFKQSAIISIDMQPKAVSDAVRLTSAITITECLDPSRPTTVTQTNLDLAMRALIPNSGALVIDAGDTKNLPGEHFWLIITPTLVDPFGKPIHR